MNDETENTSEAGLPQDLVPSDPDFPVAKPLRSGHPPVLDAVSHARRKSGKVAREAKAKPVRAQSKGKMRGRRLTDHDRLTIVQVYGATGGNANKTAERMGLNVDTVYRILREYKAQTKSGQIELSSIVAGELKQALTAKARTLIDSFQDDDLGSMPPAQRAITLGIMTDKAIKLMEVEQKDRELNGEVAGSMPSAATAGALVARIQQAMTQMPWLQVSIGGQQLMQRVEQVAASISPRAVEALPTPALDMDGNDVGRLAPGRAEADAWADESPA